MNYTVEPYEYKAGRGAQILDAAGVHIIATVRGTNYPVGSACQADVDLARVMAAAPEMLAALEHINDEYCNGGMLDGTDAEAMILAAIAKAVQS